MQKVLALLAVVAVAGCEAVPQTSARAATLVGKTAAGQDIYRFRLTLTNALGVKPIPYSAVEQRAAQICPGGHSVKSIDYQAERRVSGVIYTDLDATIACA